MKTMDRYERVANGYADDDEIEKFQDEEAKEFYWKSYPNIVTVFIN